MLQMPKCSGETDNSIFNLFLLRELRKAVVKRRTRTTFRVGRIALRTSIVIDLRLPNDNTFQPPEPHPRKTSKQKNW